MIIADTGFWLALTNVNDSLHRLAVEKLDSLTEPLITTWPVITEVCYLLLKRRGVRVELAFLRSYQKGVVPTSQWRF